MVFTKLNEKQIKEVEKVKKKYGSKVASSFRARLSRGVKSSMAKKAAIDKFHNKAPPAPSPSPMPEVEVEPEVEPKED